MRTILYLALFIFVIAYACTLKEPMNDSDTFLANKLNAEWVDVSIDFSERRENGILTDESKRVIAQIRNVDSIDRIFDDHNYAFKRAKEAAVYITDSMIWSLDSSAIETDTSISANFSLKPKEIEVLFIKERSILFLNIDKKKSFVFNWDGKKKLVEAD